MPPKKAPKVVVKTSDTRSGAKTRSSAKSALAPKPAVAGKKKPAAKSKKAQHATEEEPGTINAAESEENGVDNTTGELWELTIKTMHGNFTVRVPPTAGVMDLKEKIAEAQGVPVEFQRLMFKSKIFTDDHPLTVYEVTNGSEIYFVLRMRGA